MGSLMGAKQEKKLLKKCLMNKVFSYTRVRLVMVLFEIEKRKPHKILDLLKRDSNTIFNTV